MEDDTVQADVDALVQHVPDLVMAVDGAGVIRQGSRSVQRLLGHDPEALVGQPVGDYVHGGDRDAALDAITHPGDPAEPPTTVRLADAEGSWVRLALVPSAGDDGRGGYLVADRTVTGRDDDGRAALLSGMTDAFCAVDGTGAVTHVNDRAVELLGRGRGELVGATFETGLQAEAGARLDERVRDAMREGEPASFDLGYGPTGKQFAVQAYPSVSGATVYVRDVTEQRRVAAELEDSVAALHRLYRLASNPELGFEEKQERVLELGRSYLDLPYAFVTRIDEGTQTILAAAGDHELLQSGESCPIERSYCRKTVRTEGILAMHDAVAAGMTDDPAYETFELGSYIGGKLVVDGERYGTLCFAATTARDREFSGSERAFVEVATSWLAYEVERREYQQQLEERNERLEEFASFVSHDLRNPLNVAEGELELAMAEVENEHLEEVAWAHERMHDLIGDLLALARGGDAVDDPTTVDLPTVVDGCWRNVDTGEATLLVDVEGRVEADEGRLRQLFENLFRNAIEHGGPEVTVTVGDLDDGFYVADDGAGVPEADRDQVFEAGFTTDEDGTGFGLQIVAQVAEAHGWAVAVTESDEGGARFEVTGVERR